MTFYVVGIGASAGGLEAVIELLGALPARTGIACIVVQHLDPHHESLLPEILAKKAAVPVSVPLDAEIVQPDHVYIIPPDATLTVVEGRFHLTQRPPFERHLPVDALFSSLAVAYGDRAIGVVLSGGDSDGSLGIQAIKHDGGIVFAQRPESARFPNMPRHAIDTGCVDHVLSPIEIAHELERLSQESSIQSATPEPRLASMPDAETRGDEALLRFVFRRLRESHGLDFTHYKRSTLRRRLARRMTLRRIESLEKYCTLLDGDPEEMAALHQDFLIRVTEFFRDPGSFEALRREIFPAIREVWDAGQPIRIWVPGCSTGEEVYSIVIELLEFLGGRVVASEAQIFGTDVSEAALEKARAGVYLTNVMRDVSSERLQRFFEKHDDGYRIVKEVRDLCVFARQDVTRDPPFSRLDLVSCRNLLIYLDEVAQRRMLQAFHFALRPQGTLIIGPAESVGQSSELFEQIDKRYRIYRRRPGSGAGTTGQGGIARHPAYFKSPAGGQVHVEAESISREADRWLLAHFAPASILVDDALNIQQFRGRTGPFLEPVSGTPSLDLRRIVRQELLVEILPAIRKALETGLSVRRDALHLDAERDVSIEVVPLAGPNAERCFLILLADGSYPARGGRPPSPPVGMLAEPEKDRRLAEQQREIETMRDYLRAAIEEHGAVQEELKAAHEEMLSANEEYQSTNEELETSKEELQSTNEELTTTIEELRTRNRDLGILNSELDQARIVSDRALAYADGIIETVRSPLAVIDGDLKIKRVNRAFASDLEIRPEDVEGLFIHDVDGGRWNIPELRQRLNAVIRDDHPIDKWEVTLNLPLGGRRVVTLNARRIPGDREREHLVLLAIDDVTDRASIAADLLANNRRKDEFLSMLSHELRHPLTPIVHAIHLLRLADIDPTTAALYETIDTQTRRLVRFVNELMDIARIGRGLLEITREPLDLVDVVQQAVESIRPLVQHHGHTLTLALPNRPILVNGDASRLNQVVSNLLENATKYTETAGQITLTLEQQGDEAVLSVRDNGVGIAQEELGRIFEVFTQADSTLGRKGGGLGLGLSVVQRVLGLHGGRIEARSAGLASGSEFIVWLPTVSLKEGSAPRARSLAKASSSLAGPHARKKVLIVDDHEEITTSLRRLIGLWGHEIAVADDATSALALAAAFQPDCAIVDIGLPGVSGYDLAPRLRKELPAGELCLIAFTGHADDSVRAKCRAAGFDACVVKPGEIDELEGLLRGVSEAR